MDIEAELRKCLLCNPRSIPQWFRYDKHGSIYNDKCVFDSKYYYFFTSEMELLESQLKDALECVEKPCVLVDMGSGSCIKTKLFINAILQYQPTLRYLPVDISEEFLREACKKMSDEYDSHLDIEPIACDYTSAVDKIRNIEGKKLIVWLGGLMNLSLQEQMHLMRELSTCLQNDGDCFIATLDVTSKSAEEVERAYLDPDGFAAPLYWNQLWRLNRDYGGNIDTDQFELQAEFVQNRSSGGISAVQIKARAKSPQDIQIPGLDLRFPLAKGECINLYTGEGISCKYTLDQVSFIAERANLKVAKTFLDSERNVGLFCFKRRRIDLNVETIPADSQMI